MRTWKVWREWLSHSGHWLTPACLPFLQYCWLIWTGLLHEGHIKWQDWQDIELAQVIQGLVCFQYGKNRSMLCSFLPGTGTGNMIPGSDRIPGSRNTVASATKKSSSRMGSWKTPAFSTIVAKETLFVLTLCEHGSLFGAGDQYDLDCCMNARSIGKTELAQVIRVLMYSSRMAEFLQCSAHSCPELQQATWFLVATGFLEAVTQQHQQPRNLLHTRLEMPGKCKLF